MFFFSQLTQSATRGFVERTISIYLLPPSEIKLVTNLYPHNNIIKVQSHMTRVKNITYYNTVHTLKMHSGLIDDWLLHVYTFCICVYVSVSVSEKDRMA